MGTWQLDPFHTQIEFAAKHLGMMTVRGHFTDISSTADLDPDNLEAGSVEVTIQMASVQTHHQQRDADLRASNLLDVDQFPTATFKSDRITKTGAQTFDVTGRLTIKDVTRSVTLAMTHLGEFNDPAMGHRIGYSGTTSISRKDFGMSFNPMLDGRMVVADTINISLEGELVEAPEDAPAEAN